MAKTKTTAKTKTPVVNDHNGFDEIQNNINSAIDSFVATRDEMKSTHKADKIQMNLAECSIVLNAILHYQTHGDYRPLGRVINDVKVNKKAIRAIRYTIPGLVMIIKPKGATGNNQFAVMLNEGFNNHEQAGFFNTDCLNWIESALAESTADSTDVYSHKVSGWDTQFSDVAKRDVSKIKKSLSKGIENKLKDLKKRNQSLTQAEVMECVASAFASFNETEQKEKIIESI